jgi:hypothetical protein
MLNIQYRHLYSWSNISAIIIDGHNDSHNGSNDLDNNSNKSDDHDSLRTLFFPAKLGGNSLETDLGVDIK